MVYLMYIITYKIAVTATPNGSQWAYPRIAGKD